ncbi:DivIVA domain-containing protein [Micromonospora sp. HM5-17]|nr:DivIVA domain-containing protein [Micromonospora sp. HM5-17]
MPPGRRLGSVVHRPPSVPGRLPVSGGRVLWPSQVRSQRFRLVGFGRRGVDPEEVAAFLDRVAGDLAWAYGEVASLREQNARIKDALRSWQSRHAPTARDLAGYR